MGTPAPRESARLARNPKKRPGQLVPLNPDARGAGHPVTSGAGRSRLSMMRV